MLLLDRCQASEENAQVYEREMIFLYRCAQKKIQLTCGKLYLFCERENAWIRCPIDNAKAIPRFYAAGLVRMDRHLVVLTEKGEQFLTEKAKAYLKQYGPGRSWYNKWLKSKN